MRRSGSAGLGPDGGNELRRHIRERAIVADHHMPRPFHHQWCFPGQPRLDFRRAFAAARREPLRQNRRRGRNLDHCQPGKGELRQRHFTARNIRHHHAALRQLLINLGGNAIIQPMRMPVQGKGTGLARRLERFPAQRDVLFAAGIGRPGNHTLDETETRVLRQRGPGRIDQRVLADAGWADNRNDATVVFRGGGTHGKQETRP